MGFRIVVISDSHGNRDLLSNVMLQNHPYDMIIHCGDGLTDICAIDIPDKCVVIKVNGNTDTYSNCDADDIVIENVQGKNIMVVHGHQLNVKSGLSYLIDEAGRFDADVVLFGHTHTRLIRRTAPILFNPGSLSNGHYGIIDICDEDWIFEHRDIKRN